MKILIVIYNITYSGGTERAAVNLANMLNQKGYTVSIISLNSNAGTSSFYMLNGSVSVIHMRVPIIPVSLLKKVQWYFSVIKKLKPALVKINPNVIIGEGHNINSMLPFLGRANSTFLIGCEHIVFTTIPRGSRLIMKLLYRYLDCLVVLSDQAKEKTKSLNKHINVIPNALSFLPEQVSDLSVKRLLMVGRLSTEKGYDRLAPIAMELKKRFPDWHIDIFGDGDIKSELINLYSTQNVDDYISINNATKNIEKEYMESSIYLMTSYSEAMPMVLLEAKSCGLAIVGYACEGTLELIIDKEDGFIVEDGDEKEMIERISMLIEDNDLRQKMGARARENAMKYSSGNIIEMWNALLKK